MIGTNAMIASAAMSEILRCENMVIMLEPNLRDRLLRFGDEANILKIDKLLLDHM